MPDSRKKSLTPLFISGAITVVFLGFLTAYFVHGGTTSSSFTASAEEENLTLRTFTLRQTIRTLWSEQTFWTYQYIFSVYINHPSEPIILERLKTNAAEIGSVFEGYYTTATKERVTELLGRQAELTRQLPLVMRAGDDDGVATTERQMRSNAEILASYLSDLNPNWKKDALFDLLNGHTSLLVVEAQAQTQKNWKEAITSLDRMLDDSIKIADIFTFGIAKQYPEKF